MRSRRGPHLGDLAAVVPFGIAAFLALGGWSPMASWRHSYDLDIYLQVGRDVIDGLSPYGYETSRGLGFTYPPVAALPFAALSLAPAWAVRLGWTLAIALIGWGLVRLARRRLRGPEADDSRTLRLVVLAAVLTAATEPVFDSMVLGQLSPFIGIAGIFAFTGDAGRGRWAGLGGALKLTPLGQLPAMLALPDRLERIGWAAAAALIPTAIGVVVLPGASLDFFTGRLWDTQHVGSTATASNISLAGAYAHFGVDPDLAKLLGLLLAAALGAAWLIQAFRHRPDRLDLAIGAGALVALALPVTWSHHVLVVSLAVAALALRGWVWPAALLALFWSLPIMEWSTQLDDLAGDLLGAVRPLTLVALVVATAWVGLLGPPPHSRPDALADVLTD